MSYKCALTQDLKHENEAASLYTFVHFIVE